MRISELAARAGVALPTVKFYLREGLLPPGRRTSATQAVYDAEHLARLRLVRALIETGGLSLARVRAVIDGLDAPSLFEALGLRARRPVRRPRRGRHRRRAPRRCGRWAGTVHDGSPAMAALARALRALADVGLTLVRRPARGATGGRPSRWPRPTSPACPATPPTAAVRPSVLGTVLREPVLLALRRLAQESQARRQWGG